MEDLDYMEEDSVYMEDEDNSLFSIGKRKTKKRKLEPKTFGKKKTKNANWDKKNRSLDEYRSNDGRSYDGPACDYMGGNGS